MARYKLLESENYYKIELESIYLTDDKLFDKFIEIMKNEEGFKVYDEGVLGGRFAEVEYNGVKSYNEVESTLDEIFYELGEDWESELEEQEIKLKGLEEEY